MTKSFYVILFISIVIFNGIVAPAAKFLLSDNSNNCMEMYLKSGSTKGYIFKFDSNSLGSYDVQADNSPYLKAMRQLGVKQVGTIDGCIASTDNIFISAIQTDQCFIGKLILTITGKEKGNTLSQIN